MKILSLSSTNDDHSFQHPDLPNSQEILLRIPHKTRTQIRPYRLKVDFSPVLSSGGYICMDWFKANLPAQSFNAPFDVSSEGTHVTFRLNSEHDRYVLKSNIETAVQANFKKRLCFEHTTLSPSNT